jgi:hypothetical protein
MHSRLVVTASLMLLILSGAAPLHASAIDSTLFTTYTLPGSKDTSINWTVCGSLPGTSGCYGAGTLGPFGRVGAMIEGSPAQNRKLGTVTRYIYVLDVGYGSGGNEVALYVYKKVDVISGGDDSVSTSLFKTVTLPLTGGPPTIASMGANAKFLYVGTNQDQLAVQVQKSDFAITQFSQVSGPYNVTSITADLYGFVTVTWGDGAGFYVLSPTGEGQVDGGGAAFMLNTLQATIPSTVQ